MGGLWLLLYVPFEEAPHPLCSGDALERWAWLGGVSGVAEKGWTKGKTEGGVGAEECVRFDDGRQAF